MNEENVRKILLLASTVSGWLLGNVLGGYDKFIRSLLICSIIDYITGLMAAKMGKSPKSKDGKLSSKAGIKGIRKKIYMYMLIGAIVQVDLVTNMEGQLRMAIICALISNEIISITENGKLMEFKVPKCIDMALKALKKFF